MHRMSPEVALNGRADTHQICPVLKVYRPCHCAAVTSQFDPEQTLDVWPHLPYWTAVRAYRELRLEPLCCPRLSRGTAPHEREYPRRKDRF